MFHLNTSEDCNCDGMDFEVIGLFQVCDQTHIIGVVHLKHSLPKLLNRGLGGGGFFGGVFERMRKISDFEENLRTFGRSSSLRKPNAPRKKNYRNTSPLLPPHTVHFRANGNSSKWEYGTKTKNKQSALKMGIRANGNLGHLLARPAKWECCMVPFA